MRGRKLSGSAVVSKRQRARVIREPALTFIIKRGGPSIQCVKKEAITSEISGQEHRGKKEGKQVIKGQKLGKHNTTFPPNAKEH